MIKIENKQTIVDVPLCHLCKKESPTLISIYSVTGEDSYCEACFYIAGNFKKNKIYGYCPVCKHTGVYHAENCILLALCKYYGRPKQELEEHEVIIHEDLWIEAGRLRVATKSEGKVTAGMFPDVTHVLKKGSVIKIIMEGKCI